MEYTKDKLVHAVEEEKEALLRFYRSFVGKEGCTWNEGYPSMENIESDMENGRVFVLRDEKGLAGAISIDDDPEVDDLSIWTIRNARELARICVREDLQGEGIGKLMVETVMERLKEQGHKGVHLLVSPGNAKALACYNKFGFNNLGHTRLFEEDWFCYEREL